MAEALTCRNNLLGLLLDVADVVARDDFLFPGLDLGLSGGRQGCHDGINNIGDLEAEPFG